jgi:glycosyltransferase involved in cell wall biosynthesis
MSDLEKLTLAIPIYNDGKHLRATLESCVRQAGRIWLYDNCSADGSSEICAEYAKIHPHVTHIRHERNLGAVENFRQPLFACETPYFMWLGAHDLVSPNYSAPLIRLLEEEPLAALAVGDITHIDEEGAPYPKPRRPKYTRVSDWDRDLRAHEPLKRMSAFIREHFGSRHDSFLFHGIFRTELLRRAWLDTPCLAFDDAILTRAAGLGKILHNPESLFHARHFKKSRPKATESERTANSLAETANPVERSRRIAILSIIQMITEVTHKAEDLPEMFRTIGLVKRFAVKPSRARRNRLLKRIGLILCLIGAIALIIT